MSFDFDSSQQVCDHYILMERYAVDVFDFRTLRLLSDRTIGMRAPINGLQQVRLYIGGARVQQDDATYGWDLARDPNRIDQLVDAIFYNIVFRKPVRWTASLMIEVSYITRQPFCLKCGGTGGLNDWSISPTGQPVHLTGAPKMAHQSLKYILTSVNPFDLNLTCPLKTYVGRKRDLGITDTEIAAVVNQALSQYQQVQAAQRTVQVLDATEVLKDVSSVAATEDPDDPTMVYVTVQVQGYGGMPPQPLNIAMNTSNPQ